MNPPAIMGHISEVITVLLCSLQSTAALSALPDLSHGVATGCREKAERSYESQPVHTKAAGASLWGQSRETQRGKSDVCLEGRAAWVAEVRSWFHQYRTLPPNIAANALKV